MAHGTGAFRVIDGFPRQRPVCITSPRVAWYHYGKISQACGAKRGDLHEWPRLRAGERKSERTMNHANLVEWARLLEPCKNSLRARRLADIYMEARTCCSLLCGYTELLGMIGKPRSADLPDYHTALDQIMVQEQKLSLLIQIFIVDAERDRGSDMPASMDSWQMSDDLEVVMRDLAAYQSTDDWTRLVIAYTGARPLLARLRSDLAVLTAIHDPLTDPLPQPYQTILQRIERTAQRFLLIFQILGRDAKD